MFVVMARVYAVVKVTRCSLDGGSRVPRGWESRLLLGIVQEFPRVTDATFCSFLLWVSYRITKADVYVQITR